MWSFALKTCWPTTYVWQYALHRLSLVIGILLIHLMFLFKSPGLDTCAPNHDCMAAVSNCTPFVCIIYLPDLTSVVHGNLEVKRPTLSDFSNIPDCSLAHCRKAFAKWGDGVLFGCKCSGLLPLCWGTNCIPCARWHCWQPPT